MIAVYDHAQLSLAILIKAALSIYRWPKTVLNVELTQTVYGNIYLTWNFLSITQPEFLKSPFITLLSWTELNLGMDFRNHTIYVFTVTCSHYYPATIVRNFPLSHHMRLWNLNSSLFNRRLRVGIWLCTVQSSSLLLWAGESRLSFMELLWCPRNSICILHTLCHFSPSQICEDNVDVDISQTSTLRLGEGK